MTDTKNAQKWYQEVRELAALLLGFADAMDAKEGDGKNNGEEHAC